MKKLLYTSLLCVLLSACVSNEKRANNYRNELLAEGKPQAYADGYYDGCMSSSSSKIQKDVLLARDNKLYEMGWEDGYKFSTQQKLQTEAAFQSLQNTSNSLNTIGTYGY